MNCREAQELRKMFHYTWLLMSIVLVVWELPEDSEFPSIVPDLLKVAKYVVLWATKDARHIRDSKISWILMKLNIRISINCKP